MHLITYLILEIRTITNKLVLIRSQVELYRKIFAEYR